jgi:hypothetical protein
VYQRSRYKTQYLAPKWRHYRHCIFPG